MANLPLMGNRGIIFLLAASFCLLLAGCTLYYRSSPTIAANDTFAPGDITIPKYANPNEFICKELAGDNPCGCFRCENKTPWQSWFFPLSLWYDESLKGGRCEFQECNMVSYNQSLYGEGTDFRPRVFAYGFGPSFLSTDYANLYCNYSLQIATKWMLGEAGAPPRVPSPQRAMCWLDRNTLPLYLYYTGSAEINPTRTEEIARSFDEASIGFLNNHGTGPVLITTEVDFDSSDPAKVDLVRQQIKALDTCDRCLTVLAVKSGDMKALHDILGTRQGGFDPIYYDMVDVIGFGFRANDNETCNINQILSDNYVFARDILKEYGKPTILLYAGASEGNSSDGSCQWSPEMVHNFYQNVFALSQPMASSGVMGASFYEFFDGTGPLPCNGVQGCSFGVFTADQQKQPEMNSWAHLCQAYGADQDFRPPVLYSRNGYGSVCDLQTTNQLYATISTEINTSKGLSYSQVDVHTQSAQTEHLGCGEVCVSDDGIQRPEIYDDTGNTLSGMGGVDVCLDYPQIDRESDDQDVSAMYMRAVVSQESSFDPWVVSCNPTPCGHSFLTMDDICTAAGYPPNCPAHTLGGGRTCPSSTPYFCAFGLVQCINPPHDTTAQNWGCKSSRGFYDPFDPSANICCGVHKMRDGLDTAEAWIESNWGELSYCADGIQPEEKGEAAYYLASLDYYGPNYRSGQLSAYISQRDCSADPTTNPEKVNFIAYLKTLGPNYLYPAQVMSRYIHGVDVKCDSDCIGAN